MDKRICNSCNTEKNITAFPEKGGRSKQRSCKCSACKSKTKRANNPNYERSKNLKRKYGITLLDYQNAYNDQQGLCKICGEYRDLLMVDHCHDSKAVRGLLCGSCNSMLGFARDNSNILGRAILYLKQTNTDKY